MLGEKWRVPEVPTTACDSRQIGGNTKTTFFTQNNFGLYLTYQWGLRPVLFTMGGERRHAKKIDEEMNSTKCADILRDSGKVRGLVTDTRGVLSSDFKEFIKLMAKSAAHANWESYGASSPRAAIGIFINLFNTRIGTAISRASATWISKCCDDLRTYYANASWKPSSRNWQWKATRARHREQWREYRDCFDAAHHRQEGHGWDRERWFRTRERM